MTVSNVVRRTAIALQSTCVRSLTTTTAAKQSNHVFRTSAFSHLSAHNNQITSSTPGAEGLQANSAARRAHLSKRTVRYFSSKTDNKSDDDESSTDSSDANTSADSQDTANPGSSEPLLDTDKLEVSDSRATEATEESEETVLK